MSERLQTLKYTLTVEGETEQWYFQWLRDQINSCPERTYNISVNAKVQQSPERFYKGTTRNLRCRDDGDGFLRNLCGDGK